jgi:serine/threonine protein kinase
MTLSATIWAFAPPLKVMQFPSPDLENPLPIGTVLDSRYQIVKLLGEGGFGRTYLAVDSKCFDRNCVIKEFRPRTVPDSMLPKALELFEREAKTLNQFSHPQIPKFYGWFEQYNRRFLVQDYIEGQNYSEILRQRLQEGQVFSEIEVIQWLKDLLPVLEYIHGQKIFHRDISPDNIMQPMQQSGQQSQSLAMLIDFGVAKVIEAGVNVSPEARRIWGTSVGKYAFSAPEQINSGECSASSDLYSLAMTALYLLTGKDRFDLFDDGTKTWVWQAEVHFSASFVRILEKLLAEKPENRYQTAIAVLSELNALDDQANSNVANTEVLGQGGQAKTTGNAGTTVVIPPNPYGDEQSSKLTPRRWGVLALRSGLVGIVCIAVFGTIVGIWLPRNLEVCQFLNNCPKHNDLFVPPNR